MKKVEMYLDNAKLPKGSISNTDKIVEQLKSLCFMPNMSVEQSFTTKAGELRIVVKRGA